MQSAVCPVCGEAVAFVPDNWAVQVIHGAEGGHVTYTERPRPPHVIPDSPDR